MNDLLTFTKEILKRKSKAFMHKLKCISYIFVLFKAEITRNDW